MIQRTLSTLLTWATENSTKSKFPTPQLDAEVLLAHVLKIERVQLHLQPDKTISEDDLINFKKLIGRRLKGEPVSYIRGFKEFWSLPFKVGSGVMIPRPDTEVLIESVTRRLSLACPERSRRVSRKNKMTILDIGTGAGNLAIAIAKEFPNAEITATDISDEALKYAKQNAKLNNVDSQINFIKIDFLTSDERRATSDYDVVVSNPPYIPTDVIKTLDPGIRDYEPLTALDGGPDGLDFYRKIGESLPHLLKPNGLVAVEIGEDQACQVKEIFKKSEVSDLKVIKDYSGLDRVIVAKNVTRDS